MTAFRHMSSGNTRSIDKMMAEMWDTSTLHNYK